MIRKSKLKQAVVPDRNKSATFWGQMMNSDMLDEKY